MSDCRFGVSPVNYPDPDPDLFRISAKVRQTSPAGIRIKEYVCFQ